MRKLIVPVAALIAAGGLTAATPPPITQAAEPAGSVLYRTHCAVCHGTDAHGDGPWADLLAYRPADLTRIAIRSRGEFPAARVRAIIDGRTPVKGHLPTGMPIWGDVFKTPESGYSETAVRAKLESLVDYLRTLQVPPEDRRAGDVR